MRAHVLRQLDAGHRRAVIKHALRTCIEQMLEKDWDLIAYGAHEQAICHRLAIYLERNTDLNVDCEYNRNMMNPKALREGKHFRPDIIIHRRLANDENALVIEAKSRARNGIANDVEKLNELTAEHGEYGYWVGASLVFFNKPTALVRSKNIRVAIEWFPQPADRERDIIYPVPNGVLHRIEEWLWQRRSMAGRMRVRGRAKA